MQKDLKKYFLTNLSEIIEDFKADRKGEWGASKIITQVKSAVNRIVGIESEYYKRIDQILQNYQKMKDSYYDKLAGVIGVVEALYSDIKSDYLKDLVEIIHGEIFSDYLEMAEFLLEEGFKDASAVISGSTLEEHMRKLAIKNGIAVKILSSGKEKPKPASQVNQDLYKGKIIKKGDMMQIIAWLDIRNNSAHGNYNEYNTAQIDLMIKGIRNFIAIN